MKKEMIAMTDNVAKALECLKYLDNRPKSEMAGLGLFYGKPGTGKSRFAKRYAIQQNHIYIRLESTTTARNFAAELLEYLMQKYGVAERVSGSANTLFGKIIDIINDVSGDVIIFIDEIDYAFKKPELLGLIRDLVDETLAIVVLVGMQDAKNALERANSHYFDRCNFFVEFKDMPASDTKKLIDTIADVKIEQGLLNYIHTTAKGNVRKTIKLVHAIETKAKERSLKTIDIKDYSEM